MHKIYKNFLGGETKLIDMFLAHPELHMKFKELFLILSKNHEYYGTPKISEFEKKAAAENAAAFTKRLPILFPEISITRKMHIMGFTIAPLIANDKTDNICYKMLKIEQLGEKLHAIWNLLHRTRFFFD